MKKTTPLSLIVLLIIQIPVLSATHHVPQQYDTIQQAIDDANNGDTVIVSPGTYVENINFNGKNIVLTGTDTERPDIVAATIIKGEPRSTGGSRGQTTVDGSSVVTFMNGETAEAVLTGFTITGGYGMVDTSIPDASYIYWGGGICCLGASPTITRNVITHNNGPVEMDGDDQTQWKLGYGGGIGCIGSNAIITHNIIRNNSTYAGGAVLAFWGDVEVSNNLIYYNSAIAGGGVCLLAGRLINNTIVGNEGEAGGNVYVGSDPDMGHYLVLSNIISHAGGGEGIFRDGAYEQDRIAFNNMWGNAGGGDTLWTSNKNPFGNISQDPMFVDPTTVNFRLQMDSPCINTGDPNCMGEIDFYGHDRIVHHRVDIGAVEFEGNLRPVADAGEDQSLTVIPESVTLDAASSYDPDGNLNLTYRWSQVSGPTVIVQDANAPIATFSPTEYGAYTMQLVVSDGSIDSFPDTVCVVVDDGYLPVADAGLPVYTTGDPVSLDGSSSYDPDNSGTLEYQWQQISGPPVDIVDSNTAAPTISGFVQTDSLQICEFQLVVHDGQYESLPDTANVIIIPSTSGTTMRLENHDPFDPNKPTVIYFGGGDCINGSGNWNSDPWEEKANVLSFSYGPDGSTEFPTYNKCGDIIIAYLSSVAPHYNRPIQTMGHSTGGQPTVDAAKHINMTYQDPRYAVNRVTLLDGRCRDYSASIIEYIGSAVDGEQCWVDTYEGTGPYFYSGILNVQVAVGNHGAPPQWYKNSLTTPAMNVFNDGLVAGAYWSVIGPGKNLQLVVTPHREIYKFRWQGSNNSGHMEFFDEANYPARLPEPVTLVGPVDVGLAEGAILTCQESKNAVGYQLLLGSDPHRVMDFTVVSDTPAAPTEVITELPSEETWWTIRVYDQYGSTIYADPKFINASILSLPVENLSIGKKYGYLQNAINEAYSGDQIIVRPGIYKENINFIGKNLVLRSIDPNDPDIVATTIIQGNTQDPVVTLTTGEGSECTFAGFTIRGGSTGIYCSGTTPMIAHCNIIESRGAGVKLWNGSHPTIANCQITNHSGAGIEMWTERTGRDVHYNYAALTHCIIADNMHQGILGGLPTITNCTIAENRLHGISAVTPTIINSIIYNNNSVSDGIQMECESSSVTFSDIQGGWSGEGNIDTDPLFADSTGGDYHLKSQAGRWDPTNQGWIQDEVTSPCIDAGDPSSDWTAEPSPHGERINIGAFGGTSEASKSL